MANPTIEQLSEILSVDEAEEFLLKKAQQHEIDITAWGDGAAARDLLFSCAAFFADRTRVTAAIAAGGYNDTAEDDWLTIFSLSHYGNLRFPAVHAQGYMQLTADAGASLPQSFTAGEQVIVDTQTGNTYRLASGGTINTAGDSLQVLVKAEVAGVSHNIGLNTTTLELQTAISGITVTNGANPPTTEVDSWFTVEGSDEETDTALKARNRSKWATLAIASGPRDVYEYWARTAAPAVTRVQVDDEDATGTGNVGVYLAGSGLAAGVTSAASDAATVAKVNDYINGNVGSGMPRRAPIGATVTIQAATDQRVDLIIDIYYLAAYGELQVAEGVNQAIADYFATIPVGGTKTDPSAQDGFVLLGQVYNAAAAVDGVINVTFFPTTDISVPKGNVAYPNLIIRSANPV